MHFGTDNQLRVKRKQTSQTSNVERSYKTLVQIVFIFAKIIHRRRLTGS